MKTKELMIGDWVYGTKMKRYGRVDRLEHDVEDESVEPIPLTKEIIKKNGFSKIGTIGDSYIHCIANDSCYYEIEINLHDNTLCVNNTWFRANNIRYVNELQHALRLCRIDKEIEL